MDCPSTLLQILAVALPPAVAVVFLLCLRAVRADLGGVLSKDHVKRTCAGLSIRCATPYPCLLVVLLFAIPILSRPFRPAAAAPVLLSPGTGIGDFVFPFVVQAFLFAGAVGTTAAISGKGTFANRLAGRAPGGGLPRAPGLPLPQASRKGLVYAVVAISLVYALTVSLNLLARLFKLAPDIQPVVTSLASGDFPPVFKLLLILQCVFLGPVLEEFFFRFALLPSLAALTGSVGRAILYSTFFFTLLHGSLFGSLPLALFSVFCSIAYLGTGRIVTPIIMHMLYNASGVLVILLPPLFP